jgi:Putative zinc-finger
VSTERTEWHAGEQELEAYVSGRTPRALAASMEAHLLSCAGCRHALAGITGAGDGDLAWARLADSIDRPTPTPLARLSRGHWFARSVIATPAMVQAALAALVLIALVPLAAAVTAGSAGLVVLLVLAPLAPLAAVTLAYREWADPAGEISLATPSAGLKLVALRALAVSLAAIPLAFLVLVAVDAWAGDVPLRLGAAWFLPGLALAALVLLAGTTRLDPFHVAVAISAAWAVSVLAVVTVGRSLRPVLFLDLIATPAVQAAALAVLLAAVLLTVVRRDAVTYRRLA